MESITITTKGGELRTEPAKKRQAGITRDPYNLPDLKPWQCFAWHCTLHYLGRSLEVPDYKAGTAHCERKLIDPGSGLGFNASKAKREGFIPKPKGFPLPYSAKRKTISDCEDWYIRPTPPTAFDVLYCIVSDVNCYEQASDFEGFCGDFGYDSDSRTAEGIYKACGEVSKRLRSFLGIELFARVLAMDEDELRAWCEGPPLSPLTTPKAWQLEHYPDCPYSPVCEPVPQPAPAPDAHGEALDEATGTTGAPDAPDERVGGLWAPGDTHRLAGERLPPWQPEGGPR